MRFGKGCSSYAILILLAVSGCTDSKGHGFSKGLSKIRTGPSSEASECRSCHKEIYKEWDKSRHRASFTNELFQKAYAKEKMNWCADCHSPVSDPDRSRNELDAEGISCTVCHIRNGEILTGKISGKGTEHRFVKLDSMTDSKFCANCHQFNFPSQSSTDDAVHYSKLPMQNTYREWQNSYFQDKKNCQHCHMPFLKDSEGKKYRSHSFPGGHDRNYLQKSFSAELKQLENGVWDLVLTGKAVGHAFPTGDLFRNLEIRILDKDSNLLDKSFLKYDYIINAEKKTEAPIKKLFKRDILTEPLNTENSVWHKFIRSDELKNAEFYELILNFLGQAEMLESDFKEPVFILIKKERLKK